MSITPQCSLNPHSGKGFVQNIRAGRSPMVDLAKAVLSFHNTCDGMAHVEFSAGRYMRYNGKNISLGL